MCLVQQDKVLTVLSYTNAYVSIDGGLVWNLAPRYAADRYESACAEPERRYRIGDTQWDLVDPKDDQVIYRFERGAGIIKSADGGRTWFTDMDLPSWTQAQFSYYARFNSQGALAYDNRGPYDAILQSGTGNLVVTMGIEGVLVKTPAAEWRWVDLGPYHHVEPSDLDFVKRLLKNEFLLGLLYAALAAKTIIRYPGSQTKQRGRVSQLVWLVLTGVAWWFWLGAVFSLDFDPVQQPPSWNLDTVFYGVVSSGLVLLMFLLMLISRRRSSFRHTREALKRAGITAVTGWALFLLPYALWTQGDIPYYSNAITFAILLALATVAGGYYWIRYTAAEAQD